MSRARPGFATQDEALHAGVYDGLNDPAVRPAGPMLELGLTDPATLFVIQIGAYGTRPAAEASAAEARRLFPSARAVVERAGELYRVVLAGWESRHLASGALPAVREMYPDAWIRERVIP